MMSKCLARSRYICLQKRRNVVTCNQLYSRQVKKSIRRFAYYPRSTVVNINLTTRRLDSSSILKTKKLTSWSKGGLYCLMRSIMMRIATSTFSSFSVWMSLNKVVVSEREYVFKKSLNGNRCVISSMSLRSCCVLFSPMNCGCVSTNRRSNIFSRLSINTGYADVPVRFCNCTAHSTK